MQDMRLEDNPYFDDPDFDDEMDDFADDALHAKMPPEEERIQLELDPLGFSP